MEIKKYLNTTKKEVESRKFNIFIGISLGNKYFSKRSIKKYILWALKNTKNDVLVLIADKIHAINYEILNNYESKRASSVAIRRGEEMYLSVQKIIRSLPKKKQNLVNICRWEEARKSQYYKDKIKIIHMEFKKKKKFHNLIIKIVRENLGKKAKGLNCKKLDKLALYVLDELPIILNGVEYRKKIYTLHPYPGLSSLDNLFMELQMGNSFSQLTKKLEIKNRIAIVEGYVK